MKKIISIITMIVMALLLIGSVYASEENLLETYSLDMKILNKSENFELYILLPSNYIQYAIEKTGQDIKYEGSSTLKNNTISGINIDKNNVLDQTYKEDNIEYVQIKLKETSENEYTFDIISDYQNMDMKYRIKQGSDDYIMHIDNFKVQDGICKIEYDCSNKTITNIIKANTSSGFTFQPWQIVVVIVILILIAIISKKMNK